MSESKPRMMAEAKEPEGKDSDDDQEVMLRVARFFQRKRDENAVYGGDKKGGLESIFEDFYDSHVESFASESKDDCDDGAGFSHNMASLHEAYLAEFEKSCEWAIEVEGGNQKSFFNACQRAVDGGIEQYRDVNPELAWFLEAVFAAMDIQAFFRIMRAKAEKKAAKKAK